MVTPSTDKALLAGDHELSKRFMELENKGTQLNSKKEEIKNADNKQIDSMINPSFKLIYIIF